jgi:hypothetical protein
MIRFRRNQFILLFSVSTAACGRDDCLSIVHTKLNWIGTPPQDWIFVNRK